MGIFSSVVNFFTGTVDKQTQHVTWSNESVKYTSAFMMSMTMFIAREFSKLDIDHRIYRRQKDGKYLTSDKLGSDVYEVLNFTPNGFKNNTEWKREIAKKLASGSSVYLKPVRAKGQLTALLLVDADTHAKNPDDILAITSSVYTSNNASLYDSILTNIGSQLKTNKLRGFLKINANISSQGQQFKEEALKQLQLMQEVSSFNGLGILDGKADVVELKNEYQTIDPESVNIIKREILNGFGFSEKLLTGEYTEEDYRHFFDNVLAPMIKEFETELTYKLLTNNARINNGEKQSFERIVISVDVFKFAGVDQLIKLAAANTNGAFLTVNEIRSRMGYDPIEGGDVFRTNLNSAQVTYEEDESNA